MAMVKEKSSEGFRLLQLPPEIRIRIWRYVVVKDGTYILDWSLPIWSCFLGRLSCSGGKSVSNVLSICLVS